MQSVRYDFSLTSCEDARKTWAHGYGSDDLFLTMPRAMGWNIKRIGGQVSLSPMKAIKVIRLTFKSVFLALAAAVDFSRYWRSNLQIVVQSDLGISVGFTQVTTTSEGCTEPFASLSENITKL